MEQDLPLQPGQDLGVTEEVDRQVNAPGRLVPEGSENPIFIDRRRLWSYFFGYSMSVRRDLEEYLDILDAIQETSSSGFAITDASQSNRLVRFIRSRLRWFRGKPVVRNPDVKPDRMMLKINKDVAVSNLGHMLDILDIAKLLPKSSRPPFSLPWALWIVGCSALLAVTSQAFVANLLRHGALLGAMNLLEPIFWDTFLDYNLNCLGKELQGLKREFENGTITEKNRKAMDSWHMEIRSHVR